MKMTTLHRRDDALSLRSSVAYLDATADDTPTTAVKVRLGVIHILSDRTEVHITHADGRTERVDWSRLRFWRKHDAGERCMRALAELTGT